MISDVDAIVARVKQDIYDRNHIICPHCKYAWDWHCDGDAYEVLPITIWGDSGEEREIHCTKCCENFKVIENVERSFDVVE